MTDLARLEGSQFLIGPIAQSHLRARLAKRGGRVEEEAAADFAPSADCLVVDAFQAVRIGACSQSLLAGSNDAEAVGDAGVEIAGAVQVVVVVGQVAVAAPSEVVDAGETAGPGAIACAGRLRVVGDVDAFVQVEVRDRNTGVFRIQVSFVGVYRTGLAHAVAVPRHAVACRERVGLEVVDGRSTIHLDRKSISVSITSSEVRSIESYRCRDCQIRVNPK